MNKKHSEEELLKKIILLMDSGQFKKMQQRLREEQSLEEDRSEFIKGKMAELTQQFKSIKVNTEKLILAIIRNQGEDAEELFKLGQIMNGHQFKKLEYIFKGPNIKRIKRSLQKYKAQDKNQKIMQKIQRLERSLKERQSFNKEKELYSKILTYTDQLLLKQKTNRDLLALLEAKEKVILELSKSNNDMAKIIENLSKRLEAQQNATLNSIYQQLNKKSNVSNLYHGMQRQSKRQQESSKIICKPHKMNNPQSKERNIDLLNQQKAIIQLSKSLQIQEQHIQEKEVIIQKISLSLQEKQKFILKLSKCLQEKEEVISKQSVSLFQMKQIILQQSALLIENQKSIEKLRDIVKEKQAIIQNQKEQLEHKQQIIQEQSSQIQRLTEQLTHLILGLGPQAVSDQQSGSQENDENWEDQNNQDQQGDQNQEQQQELEQQEDSNNGYYHRQNQSKQLRQLKRVSSNNL